MSRPIADWRGRRNARAFPPDHPYTFKGYFIPVRKIVFEHVYTGSDPNAIAKAIRIVLAAKPVVKQAESAPSAPSQPELVSHS